LELFNNRGSAADSLSFFILGFMWIREQFVYILINFINFKINKIKFFNCKFLILAPPDDVNENKSFSRKFCIHDRVLDLKEPRMQGEYFVYL
jgi:hypothetical protein